MTSVPSSASSLEYRNNFEYLRGFHDGAMGFRNFGVPGSARYEDGYQLGKSMYYKPPRKKVTGNA